MPTASSNDSYMTVSTVATAATVITSADPMFFPTYAMYVPTYLLGSIINSIVLIALIRNKASLLNTQQNKLVATLVAIYLFWSLSSAARHLALLYYVPNDLYNRIAAMLKSISLLMVFVCNVLLAIERVLDKGSGKWHIVVLCWFIVSVAIAMTVFCNSPTPDRIQPLLFTYHLIWLSTMAVSYLLAVVSTTSLYLSAFVKSRRNLVNGLARSTSLEHLVSSMSKKHLKRSILMSINLILWYSPLLVYEIIVAAARTGGPGDDINRLDLLWLKILAGEFVVLDCSITPALLLYLNPVIAKAVFKMIQ
ncbi:hypothetical protein BDR26DRAFT_1011580 [Obelidium mucronatum]|nr:hypothetical protein BDR26DRAFT_1011580 [Obelidium mucronatum]